MIPSNFISPPQSVGSFGRLKDAISRLLRGSHAGVDRATAPHTPAMTVDLANLVSAQLVHDLRNQLTVVITCAERLAAVVPKGQANQDITALHRCAERASVIARELLMAARPKFVARRALDLNHVAAHAAEMLSRLTGDRIRLQLDLCPVPVPVVAEFMELDRVVLNLALNALDAMPDGGVLTLATARDLAPLDDARSPLHGRLRVTDTGRGLTPEVQRRMFEPFFTTKESGTGLGLSSVAFTISHLHGRVAVDSQPGQGTSVTVEFPLASASRAM
jgi:signal transduction histidine kinase